MTTQSFASPFRPYNPFIACVEETACEELDVVAEEETGHVSYALVQSGPAVAADEVESHLDSVEVKVTWGDQVLSVNHLEAGKGFSIGEGGDFVVPSFATKTDLIVARGGSWFVSLPTGATATANERMLAAGEELELCAGTKVTVVIDGVTIEVSPVRAGKKLKVGFLASLATGAAAAIGLSFFGHTAIVASMALFMPSMNTSDAEAIDRDQMLSMQTLMDASADREQERLKEESGENVPGGHQGGDPSPGDVGATGTTTPKMAPGHIAFKGSDDRAQLTRQQEINEITTRGLVGMLREGYTSTGMENPWGKEAMGQDSVDASGDMWTANIGEVTGSGTGPSGTGEGGGGPGAGVGFEGFDKTLGGPGRNGKWGPGNDKDGTGRDHGRLPGDHVAKAPKLPREGVVTTNGTLPADVIQRIVRQNFGRFSLCYQNGLRSNPTLQGRVVTKFMIGRDGMVMTAMDGGSDMPNQEVVSCVVKSFQNVSFPAPTTGTVTVSYPITFSPE